MTQAQQERIVKHYQGLAKTIEVLERSGAYYTRDWIETTKTSQDFWHQRPVIDEDVWAGRKSTTQIAATRSEYGGAASREI
jgi:hypothetical protein